MANPLPGSRNVRRRRQTIFQKCYELSLFGVDVWIVVCAGGRNHVFKSSSDRQLFDALDNQVVCLERRGLYRTL